MKRIASNKGKLIFAAVLAQVAKVARTDYNPRYPLALLLECGKDFLHDPSTASSSAFWNWFLDFRAECSSRADARRRSESSAGKQSLGQERAAICVNERRSGRRSAHVSFFHPSISMHWVRSS